MTHRHGAAVGLLGVALSLGACERLTAANFPGSRIQLTISGARPTPAARHLELWARDGDQNLVRLVAGSAADKATSPSGISLDPKNQTAYTIVPAVDIADPCMIDASGNLLWKPEAWPDEPTRAKAVETRIHQLTDQQAAPLLALVGYDDNSALRPQLPDNTPADVRLQRCTDYWSGSPNGAYSGNPIQLTAPVHGVLFGMLDFSSVAPEPSQILGGILVVSDFSLHDLRELWLTETAATVSLLDPDQIDCKASPTTCRGDVFLQGNAGASQRGLFHMELASPRPGISGSASVYTRLDEDPVQF